jgi:hypothetical protein
VGSLEFQVGSSEPPSVPHFVLPDDPAVPSNGENPTRITFTHSQIIRKGKAMKTFSLVLLLVASMAFVLLGCSDKSALPVSPTDQSTLVPASLDKAIITDFTFTHYPLGYTGEGEVSLVPGGKWQMKKYGVFEKFVSSNSLANGDMVHNLSLTIDAVTGEGPCHGNFVLTPANNAAAGGVWEGTYEGYRSKSSVEGEWTLPLKVVAHGKGGTIEGMQMFSNTTLTVRADIPAIFPLPSSWMGVGEGFYKSH